MRAGHRDPTATVWCWAVALLTTAFAACGGEAGSGAAVEQGEAGAGAIRGPVGRGGEPAERTGVPRGQDQGSAPGYATGADWPSYGGDPGQRRFSALDAVRRSNVVEVERAWSVRTGVRGIFEATPVAVRGTLWVSTPTRGSRQDVLALDGATGAVLWRTRLEIGRSRPHPTRASRGVAVGGGRVYVATLDARLVALDAATGQRAWEARTADPDAGYQHKQAPLYHDGRVYLGVSGGPLGIRGFVKAFGAEDGDELWTWHSIPSPAAGGWWGDGTDSVPGTGVRLDRDLAAERADSARTAGAWRRGGGAVWMTPTLDARRDLLYVGTGNPAPELRGEQRPGDNLWTSSVCAIRADDGRQAWCRQIVPHNLWGMDAASPPVLIPGVDDTSRRRPQPAVGHFSKLGIFWAWARDSGDRLTVSEPYVPHRNFLARPTAEGVTTAPGIYGGTEWSPAAYSPRTGLAYAASVHAPGTYRVRAGGSVGFDLASADRRRGILTALDPVTGRIAWSDTTDRPLVGGVLATAGDLVFSGLLSGGLAAWDARTGERLWTGEAPHPCASAPMTYRAGGRQLVAVACGGHFLAGGGTGDVVVAFALPEGEASPEGSGEGDRDGPRAGNDARARASVPGRASVPARASDPGRDSVRAPDGSSR